jgi:hypothetical protein
MIEFFSFIQSLLNKSTFRSSLNESPSHPPFEIVTDNERLELIPQKNSKHKYPCDDLKVCRYTRDSQNNINCVFDYATPLEPSLHPAIITSMNLQVKKVFYRNCKMTHFPSSALGDFPNAELLSISNTNFVDPILGDVWNCGNLRTLDLSYNLGVTQLRVEDFGTCSNLQVIDVTGCSVSEVKGSFVSAFPYLQYVVVGNVL